MAKHVIFLGAGASYTSGYPLAAELRQILSSSHAFRHYMGTKFGTSTLTDIILKKFNEHEKLIQLFRNGGFGTIDEFSSLSRGRYKEDIQTLKLFLSLIFAAHRPESPFQKGGARSGETTTAFESSDYYPFIQKLFDDDFHELKEGIAILSYNYDPYFEYILNRAYETRKHSAGINECRYNATTFFSGFSDRNATELHNKPGFCFLKLHGTSVLPKFDAPSNFSKFALTHDDVFSSSDRKELVEKLTQEINLGLQPILTHRGNVNLPKSHHIDLLLAPPILFPWEIMAANGEFVTEETFREFEGAAASSDSRFPEGSFYPVFKAIWQRAQREIVDAEKISFVGLSMHEFLKPGLSYLFAERVRKHKTHQTQNLDYTLEIILACPDSWRPGENFSQKARPNSPVAKLVKMLGDVNPNMVGTDKEKILTHNLGKNAVGGVICYDDFKSFIEAEM